MLCNFWVVATFFLMPARDEGGKYKPPQWSRKHIDTKKKMMWTRLCRVTSWCSVSTSVLVAIHYMEAILCIDVSLYSPTLLPASDSLSASLVSLCTRGLQGRLLVRLLGLSAGRATTARTPAAPLSVWTLDPPRSVLVLPPLVPPAVYDDAPPPSAGAGVVPLVAERCSLAVAWPSNCACDTVQLAPPCDLSRFLPQFDRIFSWKHFVQFFANKSYKMLDFRKFILHNCIVIFGAEQVYVNLQVTNFNPA